MEEITSDLKHLIKLQSQRPTFARTISWEFSQSEGQFRKNKSKRRMKGMPQDSASGSAMDINADVDVVDDKDISGIVGTNFRQYRLSTVESLGGSGSSDDSEYFSALEDEIDESVATDDTFDTLDSLGESINDGVTDTAEGLRSVDDTNNSVAKDDSTTDAGMHLYMETDSAYTGVRRRRPSKKQKRKKNREFRVIFANEIMALGNMFDVMEDIDNAVTEMTAEDADVSINRHVPSLVQLCMAVTSRKSEAKEKTQLPVGMRGMVSSWNKKQWLFQKQLSWLQNRLFPLLDTETNFPLTCLLKKTKNDTEENVFIYPTRSVWNAIPFPRQKHWNEDEIYTSGKPASYLGAFSLRCHKQQENLHWEYNNYCGHQSAAAMCNLSALATAIDLMLPAFVKERSLGGKNATEYELFSKGFKTMVVRVKLALKARFPRLVEEMFDRALPYVMWARGNVAMATEMFHSLISKEMRVRHKALHLSEIARMNCEFDEPEVAVQFYRLAADMAVSKAKCTDKDIEEVTEQTQVLTAGVHDNGVFSLDKARQSSACWNGALNLPTQRLATAVEAVESFLCYYAAHWTDSSWLEEALSKINSVENTHQYLKYHASMVLALQGKDTESRIKYREALNGSSISPGAALLALLNRKKIKNAWQPLLDIIANNKTPLKPLKVVWRRQLNIPQITSSESPEEAHISTHNLNIRLNEDGHIVADIQNILPPKRDICLDPYTGSSNMTHVPCLTASMTTPHLSSMSDYLFDKLHIPTPEILYSNDSGTTVHVIRPGTGPCAQYVVNPLFDLPEPFIIHWQNAEGQRAKINVIQAMKNAMKVQCLQEISMKKNWSEDKQTKVKELVQMYCDQNRSFDIWEVERSYDNQVKKERKEQKKAEKKHKDVPRQKKSKKVFLKDKQPIQVKWDKKPRIYGHTVLLQLKNHCDKNFLMFINTKDKQSFLGYVLRTIDHLTLPEKSSVSDLCQPGEFCALYNRCDVHIYNENGVFVESLKDVSGQDHTPNPCIIGPKIYMITKDRLSIWNHMIGIEESQDEEERLLERNSNTAWALADYWSLLPPTENKQVRRMWVIGQLNNDTGCFLMVHTAVGLGFMDPNSLALLPVTVDTKRPIPFSQSEDSKMLLCNVSKVKFLAERTYTAEDKQVTKLAVAIENSILVFELETSAHQRESKTEIKLLMCVGMPGFAVEACFVGKEVGILVATTMYAKNAEYYRQILFYFKLDGHCYGLLPCLGGRRRSFFPVYLHGKGSEYQPGWHVYMRDGHNGIICVRLHDATL